MATRELKVEILGDATGALKAFQQIDQGGGQVESRFGKVSKAVIGGGAAFAGATALGAKLVGMGEKLEQSHAALETAVRNTGHSYDDYSKQIDGAVHGQEKFGHASDDTQTALAVLTRATGDTKKALADMDLVTQIAAVHHSSLADAAATVAKMHSGSTRALKEFGINVKEAGAGAKAYAKEQALVATTSQEVHDAQVKLMEITDIQHHKAKLTEADHFALAHAQQVLTQATDDNSDATHGLARMHDALGVSTDFAGQKALILAKIHGTAEAQAATFGGKMEALKTRFEDVTASIAGKFGPALVGAGPVMSGVGALAMSGVLPAIGKLGGGFIDMGAKAITAGAEMVASMVPVVVPLLPIIATVALVGAAAYLLYKNWDTVWGGIKDVAGIAAGWITDKFDAVVGFFKKVPGYIGDAMKGLAGLITAPFRLEFNAIAHLWNNTIGKLSFKIPSWVPGIGGKGFDVPDIPTFDQGGIVPGALGSPQLILAHGGETVSPTHKGGGRGGDVVYNVPVYAPNYVGNKSDLTAAVVEALTRHGRRNGPVLRGVIA